MEAKSMQTTHGGFENDCLIDVLEPMHPLRVEL